MSKGLVGGIGLAVVIGAAVVGGFMCSERIPAGYVGVVYSMNGGVGGETLSQGWHLVAPTKKITTYSVGIEQSYLTAKEEGDSKQDDSFEVPSSDGKGLTAEMTFTYRFDENVVPDTFTRFKGRSGNEVKNTFIKPNIISWTKEVTSRYPVTEILGDKRSALNIELTDYLKSKFLPYGIIIESASLTNINPDDETRAAVQKKVTAQQELELANIEAKTARVQAEKDKEVALIAAQQEKEKAQIQAEQAKIKAQGDADARSISAQAEANANRVIADSLTPELIEKQKISKWNGDVPKVQGAGATIVDMTGA